MKESLAQLQKYPVEAFPAQIGQSLKYMLLITSSKFYSGKALLMTVKFCSPRLQGNRIILLFPSQQNLYEKS